MVTRTSTIKHDKAGSKPKYWAIRPSQPLPCESHSSRRMSIDHVLEEATNLPITHDQPAKPSPSEQNRDPRIRRRNALAVASTSQVTQARSEAATIQKLPNEILRNTFRFLLISTRNIAPVTNQKRGIQHNVLRTCKLFYHVGWPILYSENTFIEILMDAPKPLRSIFDLMPRHGILMITKLAFLIIDEDVRLDGLSLLAKRIQILTKLKLLWIFLPENMDPMICEHTALGEHEDREVAVCNRKRVRFEKESIIEVDKKVLKDMLSRLKSLKRFWLVGFEDEEWAKKLEYSVNAEAAFTPKVSFANFYGRHSNEF